MMSLSSSSTDDKLDENQTTCIPIYSIPVDDKTSVMEVFKEEARPPPTKYWTSRRVIMLVTVCSVQFCAFMSSAMLSPFFSGEASKRQVSETVSGFIFGTTSLFQLLSSPIIGKLLPLVGAKFILLSGMYSASFCIILFGTLQHSPPGITFAVLCFVIRAFLAVSVSAFITAGYSLLIREFTDSIGGVMGTIHTFVGLGLTVGPAVGGFLFSVGGFQLPFYVTGGITLFFAFINSFMLTKIPDSNQTTTGSFLRLFQVKGIIPITVCCVLAGLVWAFLDPTLEPRMDDYGLDQSEVGLLFLLLSSSYSLLSLIVGRISDRLKDPFILSPLGLIGCGIGLLLLGPTSMFGLPSDYKELWLVLFSLSLIGGADAFGTLPTFTALLNAALHSGMDDDIVTYSLISGWWTGSFALGEFLGPSLGAALVDIYGFPDGCTMTASTCITLSTMAIIYKCVPILLKRKSQCNAAGTTSHVDPDDEKMPIIRGNQVQPTFENLPT